MPPYNSRKRMIMKGYMVVIFLLGLFVFALNFLSSPVLKSTDSLYEAVGFSDLSGWDSDDQSQALDAFLISCERIISYDDDRRFNDFGYARDWKSPCYAALKLQAINTNIARDFFEQYFEPRVYKEEEIGLFTGYYAPLYKGSKVRNDQYNAPLYAIPKDLQMINLGDFDHSLSGRSIIGEVHNEKFIPYKDRKNIDQGALENQDLELVWLATTEETFFLHIQGSGFVELDDGDIMHIGYAQKNGRPYRAIGQYLIQSGDIKREDMSLQAILKWMKENPEKSRNLMWKNPSYVFFKERHSPTPVGSLGVGLTPGRSLAVDRQYIPLGMPLWLETYEDQDSENTRSHLKRLVIAQDTGGAIKGKTRGDVYWGIGDEAELKAGPMKDRGKYYMLVPKILSHKQPGTIAGTIESAL